jgi:hypothetical protein
MTSDNLKVYRSLDDVPAMPEGMSLYRADMRSGIPDDDGDCRLTRWTLAPNSTVALDQFETWAEDVGEGIVIDDVEKEDVEEVSPQAKETAP